MSYCQLIGVFGRFKPRKSLIKVKCQFYVFLTLATIRYFKLYFIFLWLRHILSETKEVDDVIHEGLSR